MPVFSKLSVAAFSQWGIKLLLLAAIVALVVVVSRQRGARHSALLRLGSFLFALLAIIAIVFPSTISALAWWIGVGRGTDLLLYLLVVVFLASWVVQWRRNITIEEKLTALTRELALAESPKNIAQSPKDTVQSHGDTAQHPRPGKTTEKTTEKDA